MEEIRAQQPCYAVHVATPEELALQAQWIQEMDARILSRLIAIGGKPTEDGKGVIMPKKYLAGLKVGDSSSDEDDSDVDSDEGSAAAYESS